MDKTQHDKPSNLNAGKKPNSIPRELSKRERKALQTRLKKTKQTDPNIYPLF